MTWMLASVTGPDEAEIALAGGADVIDLKDPARGALGRVEPAVVRATIAAMAGRRPVSAVAGDLPMQPDPVRDAVAEMAETGADYVKMGIFPGGDPAGCVRAVAPLADRARLIAVFFADDDPDLSLLRNLAEARFAGAMLDTRDKKAGRLLDHMDLIRLRHFVAGCRGAGLIAGLAGSLEPPDIPRLLVLSPDLLGFRGALCGEAGRAGAIDPASVRAVRALIPSQDAPADARGVDYRLLAARGYAPDPNGDPALTDRVFVRELVLPVRIGAYAHERAAPQRVRFDVEATVVRTGRAAEDMRDIFSYDLITDGIRMLIDAGHVAFVETLAERIAATVLDHARVMKVLVRVEKLDTGSGHVGVAIERTRAAAIAPAGRIFALGEDAQGAGSRP